MRNLLFLVFIIIICFIEYSAAKCKIEFDYIEENADEETVRKSYMNSRNSWIERFKNIMKGRLADPICTAKEPLTKSLCDCLCSKVNIEGEAKEEENNDEKKVSIVKEEVSCSWHLLSDGNGISLMKYANMYPCKKGKATFFITQGYDAHDGDVYDVFVATKAEKSVSTYLIQGIAKVINFTALEAEDDNNYLYKMFLQGVSFFYNWDKLW